MKVSNLLMCVVTILGSILTFVSETIASTVPHLLHNLSKEISFCKYSGKIPFSKHSSYIVSSNSAVHFVF